MKRVRGFTVIELVAVIIFISTSTSILLYQRHNIEASQRDENRKTAINAAYYNLEEVFFKKHNYYPATINSQILAAMDPELFIDPQGSMIGEANSDYHYDPINCENDHCKGYKLSSHLDKEADYVKKNRHN